MREDTIPTLRKFKPQWKRQADKQMITIRLGSVHVSPRVPPYYSFSLCFEGSFGEPLNLTVP